MVISHDNVFNVSGTVNKQPNLPFDVQGQSAQITCYFRGDYLGGVYFTSVKSF